MYKDPDDARRAVNRWRAANRERDRATKKEWRRLTGRMTQKKFPFMSYHGRWPKGSRTARTRRRSERLKNRCNCCSNKDLQAIYQDARLKGHEVDHVIPLSRGGPHCCKNLQTLSRAEHKQKTLTEQRYVVPCPRRWGKPTARLERKALPGAFEAFLL
jgi:5-methylcytosine-specific restriction endonuclease McrA